MYPCFAAQVGNGAAAMKWPERWMPAVAMPRSPGALDAPAHRLVRGRHAAAAVAVQQQRGVRLADHRDLRGRVQGAGPEPLVDLAHEPDAVIVVPPQLGVQQHLRRLGRVLRRHPIGFQRPLHAGSQRRQIDDPLPSVLSAHLRPLDLPARRAHERASAVLASVRPSRRRASCSPGTGCLCARRAVQYSSSRQPPPWRCSGLPLAAPPRAPGVAPLPSRRLPPIPGRRVDVLVEMVRRSGRHQHRFTGKGRVCRAPEYPHPARLLPAGRRKDVP